MMSVLTLLAIVASGGLVFLLGHGDPKRRRSARKGKGHDAGLRRLLATAALLPGLALLLYGGGAAFLLWLGGAALAGWTAALLMQA